MPRRKAFLANPPLSYSGGDSRVVQCWRRSPDATCDVGVKNRPRRWRGTSTLRRVCRRTPPRATTRSPPRTGRTRWRRVVANSPSPRTATTPMPGPTSGTTAAATPPPSCRAATTSTPRSPTSSSVTTGSTTSPTSSASPSATPTPSRATSARRPPPARTTPSSGRSGRGDHRRRAYLRGPQQRQPDHAQRRHTADHQPVPVPADPGGLLHALRGRRLRHVGVRPRVHAPDLQPHGRRPRRGPRRIAGGRHGRVVVGPRRAGVRARARISPGAGANLGGGPVRDRQQAPRDPRLPARTPTR